MKIIAFDKTRLVKQQASASPKWDFQRNWKQLCLQERDWCGSTHLNCSKKRLCHSPTWWWETHSHLAVNIFTHRLFLSVITNFRPATKTEFFLLNYDARVRKEKQTTESEWKSERENWRDRKRCARPSKTLSAKGMRRLDATALKFNVLALTLHKTSSASESQSWISHTAHTALHPWLNYYTPEPLTARERERLNIWACWCLHGGKIIHILTKKSSRGAQSDRQIRIWTVKCCILNVCKFLP